MLLLSFMENVAKVGFLREAHKMLTGFDVPCLTHILKSVPKDALSLGWMKTLDYTHLSTWLRCVGAKTLDNALPTSECELLSSTLDLPPQFGGSTGLQSLIRVADEELLGSWASITSDLITFFRSKTFRYTPNLQMR